MDSRLAGITHVFLDADDTLWENDVYFRKAEAEFVEYMTSYADPVAAANTLAEKQEDNIKIFGYGSKTYMLGMLDAARVLAKADFDAQMYADIKDIIVRLATHPFEWLDGAEETVRALSRRYKVVIATKGELCEQMRKFNDSGLSGCVTAIEVMERKSESDYRNLAVKMGIAPEDFLMVGNAVRSDIAPVIEMGGWAVHIPFSITWVHEVMDLPQSEKVFCLTHISQLKDLLL